MMMMMIQVRDLFDTGAMLYQDRTTEFINKLSSIMWKTFFYNLFN